jgi:decaprenyl-phosphate phosphoribosyltransferase
MKKYIAMARPNHWVKNVFILPGFIAAQMIQPNWSLETSSALIIAISSACLIASANYVLNEWLDAESDAHHPLKKNRPAVSGSVSMKKTLLFYLVLSTFGLFLSLKVSTILFSIVLLLLVMGWLYNVPPIRMKDKPYLDVLSESINNPIRLSIGWVCVNQSSPPPLSLLLGYWLGGAFLMNVKRHAELRTLKDKQTATRYRKSFGYYTEDRLVSASLFFAMVSFFFIGVFAIKYRIEFILLTPALAYLYVKYFNLGFMENSVAQRPEALYRQKDLIIVLVVLIIQFFILSFIKLPILTRLFVDN